MKEHDLIQHLEDTLNKLYEAHRTEFFRNAYVQERTPIENSVPYLLGTLSVYEGMGLIENTMDAKAYTLIKNLYLKGNHEHPKSS